MAGVGSASLEPTYGRAWNATVITKRCTQRPRAPRRRPRWTDRSTLPVDAAVSLAHDWMPRHARSGAEPADQPRKKSSWPAWFPRWHGRCC